ERIADRGGRPRGGLRRVDAAAEEAEGTARFSVDPVPLRATDSRIMNAVELSVVIPIRNEAPSVAELHRELTETLAPWGRPSETIVVDDGGRDGGFEALASLQAVDARLRVIRLRRNFGQTAAFAAGFDHARGRYIVTMDGDLQNDPADIPGMVAALERGA